MEDSKPRTVNMTHGRHETGEFYCLVVHHFSRIPSAWVRNDYTIRKSIVKEEVRHPILRIFNWLTG